MKTSLTLSTVLFALTLTPAAFANGAQEQTQSVVASTAPARTSVTVQAPVSVPRSVLERLEFEVRRDVLNSVRASSLLMEALQFAVPTLVEATGVNQKVELTAR